MRGGREEREAKERRESEEDAFEESSWIEEGEIGLLGLGIGAAPAIRGLFHPYLGEMPWYTHARHRVHPCARSPSSCPPSVPPTCDHAYHRDPSRVPGSRSRRHIARTRRLPTYMYTRAVESGFHGNGRARGRDAFNKYLLVGDRPAAARL